jgi:hypothetical protein
MYKYELAFISSSLSFSKRAQIGFSPCAPLSLAIMLLSNSTYMALAAMLPLADSFSTDAETGSQPGK